jgi:cytochrome c-type biogenesis protein CcmH
MKRAILILCASMAGAVASAGEAPPAAADPVLERRVSELSAELRCLVCQNQSLADSNADLAVDLRNQVREMMRAGKSDDDIREFMVARYGDFILYRPPMKASTLVLWIGPFILLLGGGLLFTVYLRRRSRVVPESALTDEERARARELLEGTEGEARE